MRETPEEIAALQQLIDTSYEGATHHLKGIIAGDHAMGAQQIVDELVGMKVLSIATVTARGEPRVSAVDGHFIHGRWTFGTEASAAKAQHLAARPAVSAAYIDGERIGVFAHGTAVQLVPGTPDWDETIAHWTAHYGSSPETWGEGIRMYRLEPHWFVGYRGGDRVQ